MTSEEFKQKLIDDHSGKGMLYKEFEELSRLNEKLTSIAHSAYDRLSRGDKDTIADLFDELLEYWNEHVPRVPNPQPENNYYEPRSVSSLRFAEGALQKYKKLPWGRDREADRGFKEFLIPLSNLLQELDAGEATMDEIRIKVQRVSLWCTWARSFTGSQYPYVWVEDIDYSVLTELAQTGKWIESYVLAHRLLKEGYSVEQLASYDYAELAFRGVSPEQLDRAAELGGTPRVIKSLMKMHTHRGREFNGEALIGLLESGFSSPKEIRAYAGYFNIPARDRDYFLRVVEAKKLYPQLPQSLV